MSNISKLKKINDDYNIDINIKNNNKSFYNKLNKITSIADILQILNITQLPNYWMSDTLMTN
jgi:hypothetical protein